MRKWRKRSPVLKLFDKIYDAALFVSFCRCNRIKFLRYKGVRIGEKCTVITKSQNFGTEPYLVKIGNNVTITHGVIFITHDGGTRLFRDEFPDMNPYGNVFGPIELGNNVFVGINSLLLPGTKISDNSLVGAGSIVKGCFDPGVVIAGNPGRVICSIDEYIAKVRTQMVHLKSINRTELRSELEKHFNL
jgi:acetyltransferase-like isoleucine patch superfamily enzyme